jgi:hypothetical protein
VVSRAICAFGLGHLISHTLCKPACGEPCHAKRQGDKDETKEHIDVGHRRGSD